MDKYNEIINKYGKISPMLVYEICFNEDPVELRYQSKNNFHNMLKYCVNNNKKISQLSRLERKNFGEEGVY